MKKIILLNVFTWLTVFVLSAQGWQKIIGNPSVDEEGKYISRALDGSYLIRSKSGSGSNKRSTLYRLDADGAVRWNYIFPPGYTYTGPAVSDSLGNAYSISNTSWTPVSSSNEIFKINAHGALVQKIPVSNFNLLGAQSDGLLLLSNTNDSITLRKCGFTGNVLWQISYPFADFNEANQGSDGRTYVSAGGTASPLRVMALDNQGNLLWNYAADENWYRQFSIDASGNILLFGNEDTYIPEGFRNVHLQKISPTGQLLWSVTYPISNDDYVDRVCPLPNGNYMLSGHKLYITTHIMPRYYCLDANGQELWKKIINTASFILFSDAVANPDGSLVSTGYQLETPYTKTGFKNIAVWKITADGAILPNILRGRVVGDTIQNCVAEALEPGMKNWKLQVDNLLTVTDAEGRFEIPVDTGITQIQVFPPGAYWEPCPGYETITISGIGEIDTLEIPVTPIVSCPQMEVNIGFPFLRRCFENTATINWFNYGTAPASDSKIKIVLPPELDFVSATRPVSQIIGDSIWFDIGLVNPNDFGSFQLKAVVNCDSSMIGEALCVEAHITPDSFCIVNPNWSGAHIEVEARCVGDTLVRFTIKNTGSVASPAGLKYIIIEDQVVLRSLSMPAIPPHSSIDVDQVVKDGSLYRLIADQVLFNPGLSTPITWVEGCGMQDNMGLSLQYSVNDADLFLDIDCHEVVSSATLNEKIGMPAGYDSGHFIDPNTDITYRIRFQNTGTDTAFSVALRDTLSPWLDPTSIRPEVASGTYTWNIVDGNVLKFEFDNMLLPDSNTNEAASHGFVQFRVSQKKDVPINTVIYNKATVSFDFSAPTLTNETYHTVGQDYLIIYVNTDAPEGGAPVCTVSPNPFQDATTITFESAFSGEFLLLNAGKGLARQTRIQDQKTFRFERKGLAPGVYFFEFRDENRVAAKGKIVVL
ncbi:MAG: hypothetical protein WCR52_01660 [Bacteroidota bacterium]